MAILKIYSGHTHDGVDAASVDHDDLLNKGTLSHSSLESAISGKSSIDHDSSHILGGGDAIDGDKIEISWNPTNSTPDSVPEYSDNLDHLTSHLKGIDVAIGGKSDTGHTHAYASDNHDSTHITEGSDEIDGDKLDIDWNPSNYTPTTVTETTSVDHLSSHLKGIDAALAASSGITAGKSIALSIVFGG